MVNSGLNNIVTVIEQPYKELGNELQYEFGRLLLNTDIWQKFQYKRFDKYIDFTRGLYEQGQIFLPAFNQEEHINKIYPDDQKYSGFVKLQAKDDLFRDIIISHPAFAYILNGEFRYVQSEHVRPSTGNLHKHSVFLKNNFRMIITSAQMDGEGSECSISTVMRLKKHSIGEKYIADIMQTEEDIIISIYSKNHMNKHYPLIEMEFCDEASYEGILRALDKNKKMFNSLDTLNEVFGAKHIERSSALLQWPHVTKSKVKFAEAKNVLDKHYGKS